MLDYNAQACPSHSTWQHTKPHLACRFAHGCEECAMLFAADLERQAEEEADMRRVAELAYFKTTGKLVDYKEFWAERAKRVRERSERRSMADWMTCPACECHDSAALEIHNTVSKEGVLVSINRRAWECLGCGVLRTVRADEQQEWQRQFAEG